MWALMAPVASSTQPCGWAAAIIAGVLIGIRLPIEQLFLILAIPLAVGALGCFALAKMLAVDIGSTEAGRTDGAETGTLEVTCGVSSWG